jgi:hypothetical protein
MFAYWPAGVNLTPAAPWQPQQTLVGIGLSYRA